MHTLLIHQAFISPKEAGGTRHYELAQYTIQAGDEFTIVASDISYLTGKPAENTQDFNGVKVFRAYTYPSLHKSFVWRVISFFSFMLSAIWVGLKVRDIDVVMGTSPPIFQGVSAWLISKLKNKPLLLEIRDLWPEFAIELGVLRNPILIALSRWLESFLYRSAKHLLVNSPAYRDYLISQRVPENKISFIPNGVETENFNPDLTGEEFKASFNVSDKFVVTYAGALGMANDISTLLMAAEKLKQNPDIHFLIVGDGKERENLENQAQELQLSNVTFTGSIPKDKMVDVIAASNLCVAILKDIPMFKTTYPNKVFDYMAGGRPTLLAIDGVIRDVIESANGGLFVPPGQDRKVADCILHLFNNPQLCQEMGQSARNYVVNNFNRSQQGLAFVNLLQKLK